MSDKMFNIVAVLVFLFVVVVLVLAANTFNVAVGVVIFASCFVLLVVGEIQAQQKADKKKKKNYHKKLALYLIIPYCNHSPDNINQN